MSADTTSADAPVLVEDDAHFESLTSDGVVLVDFYADWCGPCKLLEPTLEELAGEVDATVAKVNVDLHEDLATRHRVQGVPTLVFYADGDPAERLTGAQSKAKLVETLDDVA